MQGNTLTTGMRKGQTASFGDKNIPKGLLKKQKMDIGKCPERKE